jgi:hypothetical protein
MASSIQNKRCFVKRIALWSAAWFFVTVGLGFESNGSANPSPDDKSLFDSGERYNLS